MGLQPVLSQSAPEPLITWGNISTQDGKNQTELLVHFGGVAERLTLLPRKPLDSPESDFVNL